MARRGQSAHRARLKLAQQEQASAALGGIVNFAGPSRAPQQRREGSSSGRIRQSSTEIAAVVDLAEDDQYHDEDDRNWGVVDLSGDIEGYDDEDDEDEEEGSEGSAEEEDESSEADNVDEGVIWYEMDEGSGAEDQGGQSVGGITLGAEDDVPPVVGKRKREEEQVNGRHESSNGNGHCGRNRKGGDGNSGRSRRHHTSKDEYEGPRVLPVANLPDDWEGEVQDGATYLALAARANRALPAYTRVPNPWGPGATSSSTSRLAPAAAPAIPGATLRAPVPPAGMTNTPASPMISAAAAATPTQTAHAPPPSSSAGRPRHPALPKESWQILFALHFAGYKKRMSETWPPSPRIPYPIDWPPVPRSRRGQDWGYYINGYPRKLVPVPASSTTLDGGEGRGNGRAAAAKDDMEMDEEEIFNIQHQEPVVTREELEPLAERHRPREPHICILQDMDTQDIIALLSVLSSQIQNALSPLEDGLIPADYDPSSSSAAISGSGGRSRTRSCPFNDRYARWIFALLGILDPFLTDRQVSTLRELARVVMRVGAWRWVEAVMSGEVGLPASTSDSADDQAGASTASATVPPAPTPTPPPPWVLGARWKYARDHREVSGTPEDEMRLPAKEQIPPRDREEYDEKGIDETLARCWLIVHAVAAGWGQNDLIMDLESMFSA